MAKKQDPIDLAKKQESTGLVEGNVNTVKTVSEPFDFEIFFERNKKVVVGAGVVLVVLLAGFFGVKYYLGEQNAEAQEKMFQAQFYFKADSLDLALTGKKGKSLGFLQVKEEYPYTDAANLSSYYAGVIYLQKGDFKNAIAQLNDFSSNDVLLQARAYSLIGDANSELNNFAEAKSFYSKAANYKPNKEFTPDYLFKLATASEKANDFPAAIEAYDKILKEYPTSDKVTDAKKYKAYLEEKAAK